MEDGSHTRAKSTLSKVDEPGEELSKKMMILPSIRGDGGIGPQIWMWRNAKEDEQMRDSLSRISGEEGDDAGDWADAKVASKKSESQEKTDASQARSCRQKRAGEGAVPPAYLLTAEEKRTFRRKKLAKGPELFPHYGAVWKLFKYDRRLAPPVSFARRAASNRETALRHSRINEESNEGCRGWRSDDRLSWSKQEETAKRNVICLYCGVPGHLGWSGPKKEGSTATSSSRRWKVECSLQKRLSQRN